MQCDCFPALEAAGEPLKANLTVTAAPYATLRVEP